MFAIEVHDSELIDNVYKKCLRFFNQDLEKNEAFLSIITTSMPLLNKYYSEYITRYSSDTNMITDSSEYKIERLDIPHLYPFSRNIKIVDVTPNYQVYKRALHTIIKFDLDIEVLIIYSICLIVLYLDVRLLIYFLIPFLSFLLLHIIIVNYKTMKSVVLYITKSTKPTKPTITFVVPYIKFVGYPQDYS